MKRSTMLPVEVLALMSLGLAGASGVEVALHRRRLRRLGVRVHVNGTRGKSSVTRLIAAGLREAGVRCCAKTTGTLARFILPDERELPIYRPAGANIIEQKRIVQAAVECGAQALVVECMALRPELQALCERSLISATHAVITNARPDHLEVMGPGPRDVAAALAGITPRGGVVYTAEREQIDVLRAAAKDRGARLVEVGEQDVAEVTAEQLARFRYREHPDNVALALAVLSDLGASREVALRGMQRAQPDPGALTEHRLDYFGRELVFANAFAANDPVSTEQLWSATLARYPELRPRIAIFNCRADRVERSLQLGAAVGSWPAADYVLLMGSGTHVFAQAAERSGFDATRLESVEGLRVEEVFERVISLAGTGALVMGLGNIADEGLELARYFANRALPEGRRA